MKELSIAWRFQQFVRITVNFKDNIEVRNGIKKMNQKKNNQSSQNPNSSLLVPRILWGVLFLSQLMYYFVAKNLPAAPGRAKPEAAYFDFNYLLTKPFIGMAVGAAILVILAKFLLQKIFASPEWILIFIVRIILVECICLFGFVLALVQHDITRMLPFLGASVLGFFILFPVQNSILRKN